MTLEPDDGLLEFSRKLDKKTAFMRKVAFIIWILGVLIKCVTVFGLVFAAIWVYNNIF